MALTVLDAGVVIAMLDRTDVHHRKAVAALADPQLDEVILPASAYAEALVMPSRRGPSAIEHVDALLADLACRVEPISREIGRRAATLRGRHRALRLPDALVIATAEVLEADLLTTDRAWTRYSRRIRVL